MTKNLLIVESPAKSKTLKRFLGKNFEVLSTIGHIRDLPKSKLGVDPEDNFKIDYVTIRGKQKIPSSENILTFPSRCNALKTVKADTIPYKIKEEIP